MIFDQSTLYLCITNIKLKYNRLWLYIHCHPHKLLVFIVDECVDNRVEICNTTTVRGINKGLDSTFFFHHLKLGDDLFLSDKDVWGRTFFRHLWDVIGWMPWRLLLSRDDPKWRICVSRLQLPSKVNHAVMTA